MDVAAAGVATPGLLLRHRGSVRAAAVSLLVLSGAAGVLAAVLLDSMCGSLGWTLHLKQQAYGRLREPGSHQWAGSSDGPINIFIEKRVMGPTVGRPRSGEILVIVRTKGYAVPSLRESSRPIDAWHASLDVATDRLTIRNAAGEVIEQTMGLHVSDIEGLLLHASLTLTDEERQAVADQIVEEVEKENASAQAVETSPIISYSGGSGSTMRSLPFPVMGQWGAIGIGLVSMAFGLVVLITTSVSFIISRRRVRARRSPMAGV